MVTWGNPLPTHPGQPSIGQLADIGVGAILPMAYSGAWGITPQAAIAAMRQSYLECGLGSRMPPLLPVNDSGAMLEFAQAAQAAGYLGVSGYRHGANGISPASFAGIAQVFPKGQSVPRPTQPTPAAPVQLRSGVAYLTPKGDLLTLD